MRAPEVRQEGAVVAGAVTGAVDRDQMASTFFSSAKQLFKHSFFQVLYDYYMGETRIKIRSSDTCGRAQRAVLQPVWNWRRP